MSFGARGLSVASLGEEMVFAGGVTAGTGEAVALVAATAPPRRIANLLAMPPRNVFLLLCIGSHLDAKYCSETTPLRIKINTFFRAAAA
jgi:hypothetical protein